MNPVEGQVRPGRPGRPGRMGRLGRPWAAALVLLAYLLLGATLHRTLWPDPLHAATEAGQGDTGLLLFFLANTAHALFHAGGHGLLVTHALNVPDGVNVMWNAGLLLPGVLLSWLTELAGPILVLNLLVVLGPALSAWSAYLCSGRFLPSQSARVLVGLAFGFSPAMSVESTGHLQLSLLPLVPVLLLLVLDLATGRLGWRRGGLLLGLAVAAQVLMGEEVLAMTAIAAVVLLAVLGAQAVREIPAAAGRLLAAGAVAGLLTLVLVGYPLLIQFTGPQHVHGELQAHDRYKLDPAQLLVPSRGMHFQSARTVPLDRADGPSEALGFLGLPVLLLLIAAVVIGRRDRLVRTCAAAAGLLAVLACGSTLRYDGHATGRRLPWGLADGAPVLANVLPVRWMLLVDLLVALLLGWLVQSLSGSGRAGPATGSALVLAALVPWAPQVVHAVRVPVPALFARGAPGLSGAVLVVPMSTPPRSLAMTWQAVAGVGFAMPGGYFVGPAADGRATFGSGRHSPVRSLLQQVRATGRPVVLTSVQRTQVLGELTRDHIHTVVLGPGPGFVAYRTTLTDLLGAPPIVDLGTLVWRQIKE